MSARKKLSGILLGIIALVAMVIMMWDISRFLGVVLLVATIAMVFLYFAVAFENNSMYPEDDEDY